MDPEAQAGLMELRFGSLIDLLDMLLSATRKKFVNPIDVRVVLDALNWPGPEPIWCRPDLAFQANLQSSCPICPKLKARGWEGGVGGRHLSPSSSMAQPAPGRSPQVVRPPPFVVWAMKPFWNPLGMLGTGVLPDVF